MLATGSSGVVRLDGDAVGTLLLLAKLVEETILQEGLQQTEGECARGR